MWVMVVISLVGGLFGVLLLMNMLFCVFDFIVLWLLLIGLFVFIFGK